MMLKRLSTFILFIAVFFIGNNEASAQSVANYSVARSTGISYSSITSSGNSIPAWRNNSNSYPQDDNRSTATDIGFDFWYLGVRYTQFSVSSNGFVDFSSSTADGFNGSNYSYSNSAFSSQTPTGLALAPMYDDLTAQGGSEALGYSIKYLVTGTAPNRMLTIEWINLAVYSNSTPSLNFQVNLYETSGVIEFVYGTMTGGTANYSYSCGINAGTISRTPTSAQLRTQQTANTATFSNSKKDNLTSIPASNSQLTFTPVNHTGTFNGSVTFSSITSSSMNVNYSNWCSNELGYAIYNSTDNVNYTFIVQNAANSTSYSATGLSPGTQYYWKVFAVTEGKLSSAATGNATTNAAGNKVSTGTGNWGSSGTWSPSGVPSATDNVTIKNGHTVTINTTANCNNLTVGEGSSGVLRIGSSSTSRILNVNADLLVKSGGTITAGTTNATHTANFYGNITNNGTLDFSPTASRLVNTTFNETSNTAVSGTGGTTRFNTITINMDGNIDNTINFSSTNFSVPSNSIVLNSGTVKISSNYTLDIELTSSNYTLPASCGLYLNNPNATLSFNGSLELAGRINVDAGTLNIGNATDENLESTGGIIDIKGGAMNVAGRYFSTNINTLSFFNISGGTFTLPTYGSTSTSIYPFNINATGSAFNMSGGTIVIQREGGNGSTDLGMYLDGLTTNDISDGTIQFGNNSTPSSQTFNVYSISDLPNLTLQNSNVTVKQLTPFIIRNNFQNTGGTYNANNLDVSIEGNWTSTGTYTAGSNTTSFIGTGNQTINTTGGETFNNLTVDKSNGGDVLLASNATANLVTLNEGNLAINSNTLTLNNLTASNGKLSGSNTSNLTINGTGAFGTLNLLNTSTITKTINDFTINRTSSGTISIGSDSLRIKGTLDIQNGTLTTANRLILVSDASNTARIAALTNGDITGNVIAQRFIPGGSNKRQWRYLSSPVNVSGSISIAQFKDNIFITGPGGATNNFDASPNNNISFRTYLESTAGVVDLGWVSAPNGNTTTFPTGTGLSVFVRGSRNLANPFLNWTTPDNVVIDLIGAVNKGNFTINLTFTNNSVPAADGFNLVGNPYPSQIDFNASSGITKTNIQNRYWAYNPILRVYGIFDGASGIGTNNSTRYISQGQGFFVKATSSGASLQLTEAVKVANTPINFFRTAADENILRLTLEKDSSNADELIIAFKENSSKTDSDESDVPKLFNEYLNFYSKSINNTNLAINQYPIPTEIDTIPLSMFAYNEGSAWMGTYAISVKDVESVQSDVNLYLADFYLNKFINIRNHNKYQFDINADANSMGNNRFKLLCGNLNLSTNNLPNQEFIIYPNPGANIINLLFANNIKDSEVKVELVDQLGRKIFEKNTVISASKLNIDVSEIPSGIYLVNVQTDGGKWTTKFVKQ